MAALQLALTHSDVFLSTEQYCQMPVYGLALEEHLRRSNRDIASVLEECICTLLHIGLEEEVG